MRLISIIYDQLERFIRPLAACIILLVMLAICFEIFARKFFAFTVPNIDDFSVYFSVLAAYLLLGVVVRYDENIKIDILPNMLRGKGRGYLQILIHLTLLYFCVMVGLGSIQGILMLKSGGSVTVAEIPIPTWIPYLCVPIGMFLTALGSIERILGVILTRRVHMGQESG